MSRLALWASRGVTPEGVCTGVRLLAEGGAIQQVGPAARPAPGDEVFEGATLLPGLIDLQVNGGAGASYDAADAAERARATGYHLSHGTTSLLASLITAPLEDLHDALLRLRDDCDPSGPLLGVHLEGPFLAADKAGAHEPQWLCDPQPALVQGLIARAGDALRMVTLAPELPGAEEAIRLFAGAGAVVCAGHSLATRAQLAVAIEAGLSFVTHLGNASEWPSRPFDEARQFRRSEPGLVGTFLIEERLRGSVILDGFHLDPELAGALVRARGPANVALVSDATAAAGLPPGPARMGSLDLQVHAEGYATAKGGLAGSVITLLEAVRIAVERAGVGLADAVTMASATPARVLGVQTRKGALAAGADADLLLVAADWTPLAVYRLGERL